MAMEVAPCLSIQRYRVLHIVIGVLWVFFFMPAASYGGEPVHGFKAAGMWTAFTAAVDETESLQKSLLSRSVNGTRLG